MKNEATYWIALAHLPKWGYGKINSLIVKFFHDEKITIEDFFNLPESVWSSKYQLDSKKVSNVSVSRLALSPQVGQRTFFQVGWWSSGLPGLSNFTS